MKLSKVKLSVLFGAIALLAVFVSVQMVKADQGSNGYGYLWSSNIGWISMNDCTNVADVTTCNPAASYGVTVLPVAPGTMSGYMWSSNIGWITFNASGCPTNGCTPGARAVWQPDGSANIVGWARACSVYVSNCSGTLKSAAELGSWDGYIALDPASGGGTGGAWGLTIGTNHVLGGFAWGSEVMGWIRTISGAVYLGGPTAQMTANPAAIAKGQTSTLTVTATNITDGSSCSIDKIAGLTMTQAASGTWTGTVPASPTATTLYTVTCTKGAQVAKATATITVTYITTPPNNGNNGGGGNGAYCAVTNPQFAWDSDGTSCTITQQSNGNSVTVDNSSQSYGGTLNSDGLYYAAINLPVSSPSSTYSFQCTGGSNVPAQQITVPACQPDFSITASPISQQMVPTTDGLTMYATFTVSINPINGYKLPVALSIQSWPSNIPSTRNATFVPSVVAYANGSYNTSQLTITVPTVSLKKSDTYLIVIKGANGALSRSAQITVNSTVKLAPTYNEF